RWVLDRCFEIEIAGEMLASEQVADGRLTGAVRCAHNAVLDGQRVFWHAKRLCRMLENCLSGSGSSLANNDPGDTDRRGRGGDALIRDDIGVRRNDVQILEGDVQFLDSDLAERGQDAVAEFDPAGKEGDRAILGDPQP